MAAYVVDPPGLEAFAKWLEAKGYSPRIIPSYLTAARRLRPDLHPQEAVEELEERLLRGGLSPRTVANYLAAARTYLRFRWLRPEARPRQSGDGWEDFRSYLEWERGLAPATCQTYLRAARQFAEAHRAPEKAGAQDVVSFLRGLRARGLSGSTVHNALVGLRHFFDYLRSRGLRADNPAAGLRAPAGRSPLPRAVPAAEILRVLDSVPAGPDPLDLRDRALLELLAASGLRASEAAGLDVHSLDFDRLEIRLVGKGGRPRLAFFSPRCREYLLRYLADARPKLADPGEQALFLTRQGRRITPQGVWWVVCTRARTAGVKCSPHTFRHSLATALLEQGVNLRYIQQILGHARLATTEIYTRVRPEKVAAVYREAVPFR